MFLDLKFILSAVGCFMFAMGLTAIIDAVIVRRFRREIQNTEG